MDVSKKCECDRNEIEVKSDILGEHMENLCGSGYFSQIICSEICINQSTGAACES